MFKKLALFIGIFAFSISGQADEELDWLFGMGKPDVFTLSSPLLKRDFHIYVRVPPGYAEATCELPVVYLLDGGILFPMLAPYHYMLELDQIAPEAIVVGISYGGLGFKQGNLRSTDYTAPSSERDYYGGAQPYQRFLREQLLPMIDQRYRSNPERRIIVGQSLGGQFVLYTALTDPDLFWGHLAINPALHNNAEFYLNLEPAKGKEPGRMFIGLGSKDAERFRMPTKRWLDAWQARDQKPLELHVQALPDQHHASSSPAAYKAGLRWLFAGTDGRVCAEAAVK